jgi:hypothetical protein
MEIRSLTLGKGFLKQPRKVGPRALGVRVFETFDPGLENFDHFAPPGFEFSCVVARPVWESGGIARPREILGGDQLLVVEQAVE